MLRERIMGAIALQLDDRITPGAPFTTHPPTYDAYVQFDRGLGHFNRYEYAEARPLMLESWSRDSTFMPALIFAAFAALNDGQWSTADSLVQVALRHRSALNAYYAALSDYLAAYLDGDRERARVLRSVRRHAGSVRGGTVHGCAARGDVDGGVDAGGGAGGPARGGGVGGGERGVCRAVAKTDGVMG